MFTLRPDQAPLADAAHKAMHDGVPCVVAPTGAGKTVIMAEVARLERAKSRRILAVAHRAEIIEQLHRSLGRHLSGQRIEVITAGSRPRWDAPITIAMVPTLARRLSKLEALRGATLLQDECFPAGTLVDGRPIETIIAGDVVRCYDHDAGAVVCRRVVRTMKSPMPQTMVKVTLTDGRSITCTPGHPIFVPGTGYLPAATLCQNDALLLDAHHGGTGLHALRGSGCRTDQPAVVQMEKTRKDLLLKGLQPRLQRHVVIKAHGQDQQKIRIGANERAQPDVPRGRSRQSFGHVASHQTPAKGARRQREAVVCAAAAAGGQARMDTGTRRSHWGPQRRERLAEPLQAGFGATSNALGSGNRRQQPLCLCEANAGQEKAEVARVEWLDRAEVQQSAGAGKHRFMSNGDSGCYVYNLEVEGVHNYFAEGVLVHNCHHAGARTWEAVTEAVAPERRCGFTATPIRPNGKCLGDEGGFTSLIVGPQPAELMAAGHLCRYRMYAAPNDASIDTKGMKVQSTGDYRTSDMEARVKRIMGRIVGEWKRINPDGLRTITVAVSVEHAHQVAAAFRDQGVTAEAVLGDTPRAQRDETFARFRSGEVRVLVACAVVDEGLDVPEATVLQITRPTASLRLYRQLVGRVLRPAPGKEYAIILDHTDNWERLPLPDADIDWSLHADVKVKEERKARKMEDGQIELVELPPIEVREMEAKLKLINEEQLRGMRPQFVTEAVNRMAARTDDVRNLQRLLPMVALLEKPTIQRMGKLLGHPEGWAETQLWMAAVDPRAKVQAVKAARTLLEQLSPSILAEVAL